MRHVYECPMRWADLDLLGHVNNVVFVDYLQEARVDMLRVHGHADRTGELAEGIVVVRHEVSYLLPLLFDYQSVLIECWVTDLRAASFTMAYEIYHDDASSETGRRVYARATTVLTPFDFRSERPRRLHAEERATLGEYLDQGERHRPARLEPVARVEEHHFPLHVRFSDVDAYGHVNNVKYFEYFQEARLLLLKRVFDELPTEAGMTGVVVAQTDVDYLVPITFRPETYDMWSRIARVGNRSITVEAEVRDGDRLMSRARVVLVLFDLATQRSFEPSPEYRALLEAAATR